MLCFFCKLHRVQFHAQRDKRIGGKDDDDEYDRKCGRLRKLQFRHAFKDACRQKRPPCRNEEYRCADSRHTVDEQIPHTRKDRRNDERNRYVRKRAYGSRAETRGRFFECRIDLLQRCDDGADTRRIITKNIRGDEDRHRTG